MNKTALTTPVLFIIFNNPNTTKRVFEQIKKAKPSKLFVFCDGPRKTVPDDKEKCRETQIVATQVDWDCELQTLFLEENYGSRYGVAKGIDWFFDNVDEGIILEHDCLPSNSFFYFCQELLEYYRTDTRIMHICGGNYQNAIQRGDASYYFSKYNQIWGWATWKRAWKYYDVDMKNFDKFNQTLKIESLFRIKNEKKFWVKNFNDTITHKLNTVWDFQWLFAVLSQNGLSVTPNKNLVSNIGFGSEAVHMSFVDKKTANLEIFEINEIIHPDFIIADFEADKLAFKNLFTLPFNDRLKIFIIRVRNKLRKIYHAKFIY